MQLDQDLKTELLWLESNWREKKLFDLSPYNARFYSALLSILNLKATTEETALVIEGTLGKIADGYAHLLSIEPEQLAKDPWIALRRLGEISSKLKILNNSQTQ